MELLLLILKIILIAFLTIFGVLLFLLGLILLVPIRYEVSGDVGDEWEIKLQGKVTYLMSIVKVLFSYEKEQFDVSFFLFGFKKKQLQEDDSSQAEEKTENGPESECLDKEENGESEEVANSDAVLDAEIFPKEEHTVRKSDSDTETDMQSVFSDAQEKTESGSKIQEHSRTEKRKKRIKKESKKASEQKKIDFSFWKNELADEHNKSVVRKIFAELGYLVRHFKFRKIDTNIVFSTGDPATTGQVLGVLCVLPLFYQYRFGIEPDFEAESFYIKGTFCVIGKVRLIHILIMALRLILDKEVRLVVKKILTLFEK